MSKRILVADDDPLMRTFVAVCLQDLGEIRQANDGTQALSMLDGRRSRPAASGLGHAGPEWFEVLKTLRVAGIRLPVSWSPRKPASRRSWRRSRPANPTT